MKTLYVFFLFMIIFFITGCFKNNPSEEEIKKGHQELLEIKNNLSNYELVNCDIETSQCSISVDKIDMQQLADILKNTRPIYPIFRKTPYAALSLKQRDNENYFLIVINIYNVLNVNGAAVLDMYLYNGEKIVVGQYYSSQELTDWCINQFPEVFNKIQDYNESHFYYSKE